MNRSLLYWAESGGAKTSQLDYLTERIWKKFRKRSRVVSTDGGSLAPVSEQINSGKLEALILPHIDGKTIGIMRKISQGYWPDMQKFEKENKLVLLAPTPATWEEFGLLAVDGLTSTADRIFRDMQQSGMRLGKDEAPTVLAESIDLATASGGVLPQATEKIYAATQGMYMFTQKEIRNIVDNMSSLPYEMTYWTGLESKGEETVGKETIYGPMTVGSAATSKIPAWFGDCLHGESMFLPRKGADGKEILDPITKAPMLTKSIRVYYNDHQDPKTGFRYKAKPRVPPKLYGELEKRFPGGYFDLTPDKGIDLFLDFEDELFERQAKNQEVTGFDRLAFSKELAERMKEGIVAQGPVTTVTPIKAVVPTNLPPAKVGV